jgi:cytochrome oxidase Cu insertion factor (SCO1/SenC/PrrC family)
VNNPLYSSRTMVNAFDQQEGLDHLANWQFLTGPLTDLHRAWTTYGVQTAVSPAGAMVAHSDIVYIIDRHGRMREILGADSGTNPALHSSFSGLLSSQVQQIARS